MNSTSFILMFQENSTFLNDYSVCLGTQTQTFTREQIDQDKNNAFFGTMTKTSSKEETDFDKSNTAQYNIFQGDM